MADIRIWMAPERGHILPTVKLAGDLVEAGHTVTYLIPEALADPVRRVGANVVSILDDVVAPSDPTRSRVGGWRSRLLLACDRDPGVAYALLERHVEEAMRGTDLALIDGVIHSVFGIGAALPSSRRALVYTSLPFVVYGRNVAADLRAGVAARRSLFMCPDAFEVPELFVPRACYAEPAIYHGPGALEVGAGRQHGPWRRVVACSFGTRAKSYVGIDALCRAIFSMAAAHPTMHVTLIGAAGASEGAYVPDNCSVLPEAPQASIVAQSDVFISHGGLGGIKEALISGVPVIVVPFEGDQPFNAARVQYHRVGAVLTLGEALSGQLYDAVEWAVSDRVTRQRVAKMQTEFVRRERTKTAADWCARALAST